MSTSLQALHLREKGRFVPASERPALDISIEHRPAPVPPTPLPEAKPRPYEPPSLRALLRVVSELSGFEVAVLIGRQRARYVARPRQVYMLLAKELTQASLPQIGRVIQKDHTTVLYGVRAAKCWLPYDQKHQALYRATKAKFLELHEDSKQPPHPTLR